MADNDDRNIPVLEATEEGVVKSQAINEQVKQVYQTLHYLEGRVGPTTVRDDLTVMGSLSLEARDSVPDLSDATHSVFYVDATGVKVSQVGGPYYPLGVVSGSDFTTTRSVDGVQENYDPLSYYDVVDDFGPVGTTFAGTTTLVGVFSGTGNLSGATGEGVNHPGVVELNTGATNNSQTSLAHATSSGAFSFDSSGVRRLQWVVRPNGGTATNCVMAFGFGSNPLSTTLGLESVLFQVTNGGNWQCITRTGGVSTTTDSGVLWANTWTLLQLEQVNGAWVFTLNGVVVATNDTTIPVAQTVSPIAYITNTTAANRLVLVDFMRLIGTTISSRF